MWPNPQFAADLVIFTEEVLNEKLQFSCSVSFCLIQTSACLNETGGPLFKTDQQLILKQTGA